MPGGDIVILALLQAAKAKNLAPVSLGKVPLEDYRIANMPRRLRTGEVTTYHRHGLAEQPVEPALLFLIVQHPERGTSSQLIETVAGPIATKGMLE